MKHAARLSDIAKHAGVSTATVDRVLNGRANVRESTRQRVLQAQQAIESGSVPTDRQRPWRIKVILPKHAGPSTEYFARCIQQLGTFGQATIECEYAVKIEPVALARKLRACVGQGIDAVAFQALEDPRVAHAVSTLNQAGIPCVTVLSGMESAPVIGHIGSNNRAAGRTAGLMMGHMTNTPGEILIVTSGDLYRAHEAREMGFRAVLRSQFPHLAIATSLVGRDDIERTEKIVSDALEQYTAVVGIYNVGAGNQGIASALKSDTLSGEVVFIGHNLTPKTHNYLLEGTMNAVVHQNLQMAANYTVKFLIDHLTGHSTSPKTVPVEIITRENTEGIGFDGPK
ncbi:hypothetical protein AB833_08180 [Chromatiales bacterium (ex Bugula neritina AB1)]|nr:hypothetical protein AB833_08180 [Chromatiales bacterium (ex Bugula neritina AB1)]